MPAVQPACKRRPLSSVLLGAVLVGLMAADSALGHSCYYYVVHVAGCQAKTAGCLACAHDAAKELHNCTQALIQAACQGIPPPAPPRPPSPGDMALTLLPEAANATGAVCLDGSPGGYGPGSLSI